MKMNSKLIFNVMIGTTIVLFPFSSILGAERTALERSTVSKAKEISISKEASVSAPTIPSLSKIRDTIGFPDINVLQPHSMNCAYISECPTTPPVAWLWGALGQSETGGEVRSPVNGPLSKILFCLKCDIDPPAANDDNPSVTIQITDHAFGFVCPTWSVGVWDKPKAFPSGCYKPESVGYWIPEDRKSLYVKVAIKQYDAGKSDCPCNLHCCPSDNPSTWENASIRLWVFHNHDVETDKFDYSEGAQCIDVPQR